MATILAILALLIALAAIGGVAYGIHLVRTKVSRGVVSMPAFLGLQKKVTELLKQDPLTFDNFLPYLEEHFLAKVKALAEFQTKVDAEAAPTHLQLTALEQRIQALESTPAGVDLSAIETRLTALESAPATAAGLSPALPADMARMGDIRIAERKLERAIKDAAGNGNNTALVEAIRALAALVVEPAKAPITSEIKAVEAEITEARKAVAPLQKAVTEAQAKVAAAKKALLPETLSEEAMEREAGAYVKSLKLTTARERADARADYEDNVRPGKVEEAKAAHQSAQEALMEAETQLDEAKRDNNTADASAKLAELRKQLSAFDQVETALAALDSPAAPAPKAATAPRPASLPRPTKAPPAPTPSAAPPMDVQDDELLDKGAPDSVPDVAALVAMASSPPPAGPLPAPPRVPADKHCTTCGSGAAKAMKFCGKCGTPFPSA